MTDKELNAEYWNSHYHENRLGWDIGYPSTPLKEYIDQIKDKTLSVLIPGGGNSYEAEYLLENGFNNVTVVDIAQKAKDGFLKRTPHFPEQQFLVQDFFKMEGSFDLLFEQTFFCALNPSLREAYAKKMYDLLKRNGKLIGVLFDFPLDDGPPFGGSKEEYLDYFSPYFNVETFERCYNSIPPRQGNELFVKFSKKE